MTLHEKVMALLGRKDITQQRLAERIGVSQSTVHRWKNGAEPEGANRDAINSFYSEVFDSADDDTATLPRIIKVVGSIGADPSGAVIYGDGDDPEDYVPMAPGGSLRDVAVLVRGHSMRGVAEDGSLIYYSAQIPAEESYLGEVVVCAVDSGEILVKKLLRGSERGLFDLESINGETRRDARLRWIAEITAIIPPRQARRLLRR